jgi:hypothetical protein
MLESSLSPRSKTLAETLRLDATRPPQDALRDNLGDSRLLRVNPVFQGVRKKVLKLGYRFTSSGNTSYFDWPMLELKGVLGRKTIPYFKSRRPLARLEKLKPGYFHLSDLGRAVPRGNYVLHESSHAIADWAWDRTFGKRGPEQKSILRIFFEEACATASEGLSNAYALEEQDRFFLKLNSYVFLPRESGLRLAALSSRLGERDCLCLLILFYLHGLYLFTSLPRTYIKALAKHIDPARRWDRRELDLMALAAKEALGLNIHFRTSVSQLYPNLSGYDGGIDELVREERSRLLEHSRELLPAARLYARSIFPRTDR